MENPRSLAKLRTLIFLTTGTLLFPVLLVAYDDQTTHPALTQEIIEFFNFHYPELRINETEAEFVIKGSIDEDSGARWMHHFYDPIYDKGLSFGVTWQSSKYWAQDTLAQAKYDIVYESRSLGGLFAPLFGASSDFSWDRAVYEYAWGTESIGLEALGHTLHLLEDATVPDHTRDDSHPPILDFGSPYEFWTKKFDRNSIKVIEVGEPLLLPHVGNYFDALAVYSNSNFFSRDTIFSKKYSGPVTTVEKTEILKNGKQIIFVYGTDGINEVKLLGKYPKFEWQKELANEEEYFLDDPDGKILNNYWDLLSQQAVSHGSGVIKLFFDEVEKERETKLLYEKNRSWLAKKIDDSKDTIFAFASVVYGITVTKEDLAGVERSDELPSPPEKQDIVVKPIMPDPPRAETNLQDIAESDPAIGNLTVGVFPPPLTQTPSTVEPRNVSAPPPLGRFIGGGAPPLATPDTSSNSSASAAQSTADTTDIIPPDTPTITAPTSGSSASTTLLTFTGTAEANVVISVNGFTATAVANGSGSWSLSLTLGQGTTTLQFTATDASENQSQMQEHTVFVDSAAPDIALAVDGCQTTPAASGCLLMSTSVTLTWSSNAADLASYSITCETSGTACTGFATPAASATSTTFNAADGAVYTFRATAADATGNAGSDTEIVHVYSRPIVINEVAWAGTSAAQSEDEWLELYNRTALPISLSNWIFYSETDLRPYLNLSGTIGANSYYLIERTDDTTTSVAADLIASFGSGTGQGLSNSGEVLVLSYASTTVDHVPLCSNNWCGALGSAPYTTMERFDPDSAADIATNWGSNTGYVKNGTNADGLALSGTPRARNSQNYLILPAGTNSLTAPRTLTEANSPYLITSGISVASGVTLTIEPGVTVKMVSEELIIGGVLNADGTAEKPIVFTDYRDDEHGGDLSGDGSSTSPVFNSWKRIRLDLPGSVLDYVRIRYAGAPVGVLGSGNQSMLFLNGVPATITNSTFEFFTTIGIYLSNSDAVITNSLIQAGTTTIPNVQPTGIFGSGSVEITGNTFKNNHIGVQHSGNTAIPTITGNTFTNHTGGAISLTGNSIGAVLGSNTATNNAPHNGVIVSGTITQPTALSRDLPYVGSLTTQAALTIPAGFIAKGLTIQSDTGTVTIQGTAGSPAIFTALSDDSYGGDTDGNGDNSALCASDPNNILCPARGNGSRITINGSSATSTMEYAVFRYGGALALTRGALRLENGSDADLSNITFEHGYGGLQTTAAGSTVQYNAGTVRDNLTGIENVGTLTLTNTVFSDNTIGLLSTGTLIDGGGNSADVSNGTPTSPAGLIP